MLERNRERNLGATGHRRDRNFERNSPAIETHATDWDATGWRTFYDERAAIAEHDGGLNRKRAERVAYETTIAEWCHLHPPNDDPDRCAACGSPIPLARGEWRPLSDNATVHYGGRWGLGCFRAHGANRRNEAIAALDLLDLTMPPELKV